MSVSNKAALKLLFENGDIPNANAFIDLLDTLLSLASGEAEQTINSVVRFNSECKFVGDYRNDSGDLLFSASSKFWAGKAAAGVSNGVLTQVMIKDGALGNFGSYQRQSSVSLAAGKVTLVSFTDLTPGSLYVVSLSFTVGAVSVASEGSWYIEDSSGSSLTIYPINYRVLDGNTVLMSKRIPITIPADGTINLAIAGSGNGPSFIDFMIEDVVKRNVLT